MAGGARMRRRCFGSREKPAACTAPPSSPTPVNAVLAEGFERAFGRALCPADDEVRIRAHLRQVAALLRAKGCPNAHKDRAVERNELLNVLARYAEVGALPQNIERPVRTPIFIDGEGRVCAVAHLIEASGHGVLASDVDAHFHLVRIADIGCAAAEVDGGAAAAVARALLDWAASHGFMLEELAAIQPGYTPRSACSLVTAVIGGPITIMLTVLSGGALAVYACMSTTLQAPEHFWICCLLMLGFLYPSAGFILLAAGDSLFLQTLLCGLDVERQYVMVGTFALIFTTAVAQVAGAVFAWRASLLTLPFKICAGTMFVMVALLSIVGGVACCGGCPCLSDEPFTERDDTLEHREDGTQRSAESMPPPSRETATTMTTTSGSSVGGDHSTSDSDDDRTGFLCGF
eukprot:NODE_7168_length_1602_cov_5.972203.p1 GENE.NODE_7168_length_1602_cov_5.972203~~NODE_7168_length_1602_cov_5.972203.p1  ORF type:complete len:404 (+),score=131.78 NODE_7168_length_1602_cov_5.972203:112-1323(+)